LEEIVVKLKKMHNHQFTKIYIGYIGPTKSSDLVIV